MLLYYIKIALRNFKTNKVIFAGNLLTLCLSTLCISLLFSYVRNELTIDDFHKNKQAIYMVVNQATPEAQKRGVYIRIGRKEFDVDKYPEVLAKTKVINNVKGDRNFKYNNSYFQPQGLGVDSTFFKVFDFELILGDKKSVLHEPNSIVLTERFAKKMFGNQHPIGKEIMQPNTKTIFTVKGIVDNPPANSSLNFDYLTNNILRTVSSELGADFILVTKEFNKTGFEKKINKIMQWHSRYINSITGIVPLSELYFNEDGIDTGNIFYRKGSKKNVYILGIIIFVILLITVLNLTNLQVITTDIAKKPMALNLIHGASKRHLGLQKFTEGFLLLLVATIVVVVLYKMILPTFNNFTTIALAPSVSNIILTTVSILALLILLSMIYPVFIAQKKLMISDLKKQVKYVWFGGNKLLIIIQYALTIILLISSFVIAKQLDLMLNKDMGIHIENVINAQFEFATFEGRPASKEVHLEMIQKEQELRQFIENEMASHTSISAFAYGSSLIKPYRLEFKRKDSDNEYTTQYVLRIGSGYDKIFNFELVEGRFFTKERDNFSSINDKVIINEAAKKFWNIQDISNTRLLVDGLIGDYEIIGVVKDFNFEHLSVKPQPLIINLLPDNLNRVQIRFHEGAAVSGLEFVKRLFNKIYPGINLKYSFLSDDIAFLYQKEKRLSTIYIVFTIIALLISAIGLFTIALYDTRRRTKEIGVRKVNGATIREILYMLNKDFIKWVLLAFVVACPIAYYLMSNWLENFAYKTALNWWIFALSGGFTIIIALLTVSWQSFNAATVNPVNALRDE